MSSVEQLDTILTRLALTDDEKLGGVVAKLLPGLLSILSAKPALQPKVLQVLGHINKRAKALPGMALPVVALLSALGSSAPAAQENSFRLMYIEMGAPRLAAAERGALVPLVVAMLGTRSGPQQTALLRLLLGALPSYRVPNGKVEAAAEAARFGGADTSLALRCLLDVLLYAPVSAAPRSPPPVAAGGGAPAADTPVGPAPGLSKRSAARVVGRAAPPLQELIAWKLAVVRFTKSGVLSAEKQMPLLLAGAVDFNHEVRRAAEDGLRRVKPDVEDAKLVAALFSLSLGTPSHLLGKVAADDRVAPGPTALRVRIAKELSKSTKATNMFPSTLQLLFDALFSGSATAQMRLEGLQFARATSRFSVPAQFKFMGPAMYQGLLRFVGEAAPRSGPDEESARGLAYTTLAEVVRRQPSLAIGKADGGVEFARTLFRAVSQEQGVVRGYVGEALLSIAATYKGSSAAALSTIETLLLNCATLKDAPEARFAAIVWAHELFPFTHAAARWIDLVAADDERDDVREESAKGLLPPAPQPDATEADAPVPDLQEVVQYVVRNSPQLQGSADVLPYGERTCSALLTFLRMCTDGALGKLDSSSVEALCDGSYPTMDAYNRIVMSMLVSSASPALQATAAGACAHWLSVAPQRFSEALGTGSPAMLCLRRWLRDGDERTQQVCATAIGLGASVMPSDARTLFLSESLGTLDLAARATTQQRCGAALSTGVLLAVGAHDAESGRRACQLLLAAMGEKSESVRRAASTAFGECGKARELPLPLGETVGDSELTKLQIVGALNKQLLLRESRLAEQAARVLGRLCCGDRSEALVGAVVAALMDCPNTTQIVGQGAVSFHFVVGEALAMAVSGISSDRFEDTALFSSKKQSDGEKWGAVPSDPMVALVESVFAASTNEKSKMRAAGCVWLFCLVRAASAHAAVQSRLSEIQSEFMVFLGDKDDIIQEMASRGLAMVFEKADTATRKSLVENLMGGLSSDQQTAKHASKVAVGSSVATGEDKVVLEGLQAKTPSGDNISSYRDICSMCTDLGQPDLVYRFMALAQSGSMWASRAGLSMGLGAISSQAQAEIKPMLPKIIPRLYRYLFDPSKKVQDNMRAMWESLVLDPQEALETHFEEILKELMGTEGMGARQWRIREASSNALSDLLNGRDVELVIPHLKEMWVNVMRAMDDIKETVRIAGMKAGRTVASLTHKLCDPTNSSTKTLPLVVGIVLPFLVTDAINAKSDDVRVFAVVELVRIAKVSGKYIAPHIPETATVLLDNLSALEPTAYNYAQFHVDDKDGLEQLRASASASGPLQDVLDLCVQHSTAAAVAELTPRLVSLVRTAVGLPSRAGIARFVTKLCLRRADCVRKDSGKLAKALASALRHDPSAALQRLFASSMSHCCKLCEVSTTETIVAALVKHHREARSVEPRRTAAWGIKELACQAPESLQDALNVIVPLAYLGKNDSDADLSSAWTACWDECVSGGNGLKQYSAEVVAEAARALQHSSYAIRVQGAVALQSVAQTPGLKLQQSSLDDTVAALLDVMSGRIWEGQESCLDALAEFATQLLTAGVGKKRLREGDTLYSLVLALAKETTRKETTRKYRQATMRSLAKCMDSASTQAESSGLLEPMLEVVAAEMLCAGHGMSIDGDEQDDDAIERRRLLKMRNERRESSLGLLAVLWPNVRDLSLPPPELMLSASAYVGHCADGIDDSAVTVRTQAAKALLQFCKRAQAAFWSSEATSGPNRLLGLVAIAMAENAVAEQRMIALESLAASVQRSLVVGVALSEVITEDVSELLWDSVQQCCADMNANVAATANGVQVAVKSALGR